MIKFSLVDVVNISCDVPRSSFSESSLDTLADLFLKVGGLVKPILLKQQGLGYSVLAGHFEYYIAVRAREKNNTIGERVQAFVISSEVEDFAVRQATELQEITSGVQPNSDKIEEVLHRLFNLESQTQQRFSELDQNLSRSQRELETRIKGIEEEAKKKVDLLIMFNTYSSDKLSEHFQRNRISNSTKLIKEISTAKSKKEDNQFDSYLDILNSVKGLGPKTFAILLDSCQRTN